jgi:hypothetical protein
VRITSKNINLKLNVMKKIIGISFILLSVVLFSCNNDKIDVAEDGTLTEKSAEITLSEVNLEAATTASEYEVEFYANAEDILSQWWRIGKRWEWTNKMHYMSRQCPNVAVVEGETDSYPKTITLDYGDSTVLKNGKVLSGTIVIEISAPRNSASYTRMVTYDNFGIDTLTIAGTSLITVDRENSAFRNYKSDLTITLDNGNVITRSSERTWTWIEGLETTDDQTDDVIHITGEVSAVSGTDSYKKEIVDPLVRIGDCRFIVEGVVEITLNGTLISTLNYGDGECDETATMTNFDGETIEVDLFNCKMKGNQNQNKKQNQNKNQNQGFGSGNQYGNGGGNGLGNGKG